MSCKENNGENEKHLYINDIFLMEHFGDILTAVDCTDPVLEKFPAVNDMKHTHLCEHILTSFIRNPEQNTSYLKINMSF